MVKVHRGLFCELAIEAGFLTRDSMVKALKIQYELSKKQQYPRIGTICVDNGFMTIQQVLAILEKQNVYIFKCSACGKQYNIAFANPGLNYYCLRDDELLTKVTVENARSARVVGIIHFSMGFPSGSNPATSISVSSYANDEDTIATFDSAHSPNLTKSKFNVKQVQMDSYRLKKPTQELSSADMKTVSRRDKVQLDSKILAAMDKGEQSASMRKTRVTKKLADREFEVRPDKIDPAQIHAYKYLKIETPEELFEEEKVDSEFKQEDVVPEEIEASPMYDYDISAMVLKAVDRVERQLSSLETEELESDAYETSSENSEKLLADDEIESDRMILMESVQSDLVVPTNENFIDKMDAEDDFYEVEIDEEKIDTEVDLSDVVKKFEEPKTVEEQSETETTEESEEAQNEIPEELSEPKDTEEAQDNDEILDQDEIVDETDEQDEDIEEDENVLRKKAVIQISKENTPDIETESETMVSSDEVDEVQDDQLTTEANETEETEKTHLKQVMSEILPDEMIKKIQETEHEEENVDFEKPLSDSTIIESLEQQLNLDELEDSEADLAEEKALEKVEVEKSEEIENADDTDDNKEVADDENVESTDTDKADEIKSLDDVDLSKLLDEDYTPPETVDTEFTISASEQAELDEIDEKNEHIPPSDHDTLLEIKIHSDAEKEASSSVETAQTEDTGEENAEEKSEPNDENVLFSERNLAEKLKNMSPAGAMFTGMKVDSKQESAKPKEHIQEITDVEESSNNDDFEQEFEPETETMELYPDDPKELIIEETSANSESDEALDKLKDIDEEELENEFESEPTDLHEILKDSSTELYFRETNDYEDIEFDIDALDEMLSKDIEEDELPGENDKNGKKSVLSKILLDDSELEKTDVIELPERFNIAKDSTIGPPDIPYDDYKPDIVMPRTGFSKFSDKIKDVWVKFLNNENENNESEDLDEDEQ